MESGVGWVPGDRSPRGACRFAGNRRERGAWCLAGLGHGYQAWGQRKRRLRCTRFFKELREGDVSLLWNLELRALGSGMGLDGWLSPGPCVLTWPQLTRSVLREGWSGCRGRSYLGKVAVYVDPI